MPSVFCCWCGSPIEGPVQESAALCRSCQGIQAEPAPAPRAEDCEPIPLEPLPTEPVELEAVHSDPVLLESVPVATENLPATRVPLLPVVALGGAFLLIAGVVLVWSLPAHNPPTAAKATHTEVAVVLPEPSIAQVAFPKEAAQPVEQRPAVTKEIPEVSKEIPSPAEVAVEVVRETPKEPAPEVPPGPVVVAELVRPPVVKPKPSFKRLDERTEEEHLRALAELPEVGLLGLGQRVLAAWDEGIRNAKEGGTVHFTTAGPVFSVKPDLKQLPFQMGPACQLSGSAAKELGVLSKKLHAMLDNVSPAGRDGRRTNSTHLSDLLHEARKGRKPEWLRVEAVPTLRQLLMAESRDFRLMMVRLLAEIPEKPATVVLAGEAVFDLDAEVRQEAVQALSKRNPEVYRPFLVRNLRYPWVPAAQHAAEALVELKQKEAVPELVYFLSLPDPMAPQSYRQSTVIQEVVRIRHTANCLLCHPPALTGSEPVVGPDPMVTVTKKVTPKTAALLRGTSPGSGGGGYSGTSRISSPGTITVPAEVRADITFLRQDFSVSLPNQLAFQFPVGPVGVPPRPAGPGLGRQVGNPKGPAFVPAMPVLPQPSGGLRFDYLIRNRVATSAEKLAFVKQVEKADYPQREAVLFALRELTGKDVGNDFTAWQELFPHAEEDARAVRLARKVIEANPLQQPLLLNHHRDSSGEVHTLTLARAVAGLRGPQRDKAETALVERLVKRTAWTRWNALRDEDPPLCQAAIRACVQVRERQRVPDLIALLESSHPRTVAVANEGLRELTGKEFDSPATWLTWWQNEGK